MKKYLSLKEQFDIFGQSLFFLLFLIIFMLVLSQEATAEWDSNIDCLSEEYDCSNIKSLPSDEISKITYNLNQEEPQEWLSQNDWKSCGCESFFEGTLIISLEKQDE